MSGSPHSLQEGSPEEIPLLLLRNLAVSFSIFNMAGWIVSKSTVTILEEGNFTEEVSGFDWRGCFSVHLCRERVHFDHEEGV